MNLRLKLCLLFLFPLLGLTYDINQSENFILWGVKDIDWSDFSGKPDLNSIDIAHLSYTLEMDSKYKTKDSLLCIVSAVFNKSESWTKSNSSYILEHERLHFDISELYARKIRKKLKERYFIEISLIKDINEIYLTYKNELKIRQRNYDSETNHSIDKVQQEKWDKKIREELLQLNMFRSPQVFLNVKWRK
jgi:superfamily II DNA helicase RecQ